MKALVRIWLILCFTVACDTPQVLQTPAFETKIDADSITFAVIGDYGGGGYDAYLVSEMVKSWEPDFIITTGDNNYPNGNQESFEDNIADYYGDFIYNFDASKYDRCNGAAFSDSLNRFFPSPGNHDVNTFHGLDPYKRYFTLPGKELFYTFTWGDAAFYALNSTAASLEEQQDWLEREAGDSSKLFKIVYFHHSPYSCGEHGNDVRMQWDFDSLGVDVVFSGHDHQYARIEHHLQPGVHYLVCGSSGRSLDYCRNTCLDPDEFNAFCYDESYGAVRGRANARNMTLEFFSIEYPDVPLDVLIISAN